MLLGVEQPTVFLRPGILMHVLSLVNISKAFSAPNILEGRQTAAASGQRDCGTVDSNQSGTSCSAQNGAGGSNQSGTSCSAQNAAGCNARNDQQPQSLNILGAINFSLSSGDIVALTGASGAGKTTLLQIMGLLDRQTAGSVVIQGEAFESTISGAFQKRRAAVRKKFIGFVYQYHHLLRELTALENVMLPLLINGVSTGEAKKKASALLDGISLASRLTHTLHALSGGEQQRVAIARALVNEPAILLADEPTGNLDNETAEQVFRLMLGLARERGVAVVIATHNMEMAGLMPRHVHLNYGHLEELPKSQKEFRA
ncbi:MAG: ABC transporter ATP-binding protein [Holosporales bacterium]|jgi:lipoprotein-releasing system ATP-binding protein|nr:ABC transporter ATP-binding protein [Holosporales bacterium]